MSLRLYWAAAISLIALAIPFTASAQVDNISCDGCTDVQMNQAQRQYSLGLSPPASVDLYVLNSSMNVAKKYRITKDYDGGDDCRKSPRPGNINCQVFTNVKILAVEPIVVDYMGYMRAAAAFNAAAAPVTGDGLPTNSYDDMTHPQKRLAVHDYIISRFGTWTTVINGLAGMGWNTFQTYDIKFSDGSTVRYRWDTVTQLYQPIAITYKDRLGNMIPVKQEQLTEGRGGVVTTFDFSRGDGSDIANIILSLANLGIEVRSPTSRTLTCVSEPYNGGVRVICNW